MADKDKDHERELEKAEIDHLEKLARRLAKTEEAAKEKEIPKQQRWKANYN